MSRKEGIYGLVIIGIITACFASQLHKVRFNYDFTMFFPSGDPDLVYYEEVTREFGMYDDFLYVALFDDDIYSAGFLDRVHQLTETLERWPAIEQVLSPTNYARMQVTPFGVNKIKLYKRGSSLNPKLIQRDPRLPGQYFARDEKSVLILVRHQAYADKADGDAFHQKLNATLDVQGFDHRLVSGKVQAQDEFVTRLEADLGFNLAIAMLLVIVTLAFLFRTFRGVWIPLLTLVVTCIWNIGLYGLLGKELDVLMAIVPPILLIVSMSDVVHFCNKFNTLIHAGSPLPQAIRLTLKQVGIPTLLTSVTTSIGFLSLVILPIGPLRGFGIYTAIGVLFAYLIAFSLIPCLLLVIRKPLNRPSRNHRDYWKLWMSRCFVFALRWRKAIIAGSLALTILSLWAASRLTQNTSILVGIEPDDIMAVPVHFFDQQYDGYKPFELTLSISEGRLFDDDVLQALDSVHHYLSQEHGVRHIHSPLTVIKSLNQALKGGASAAYALPTGADVSRVQRLFFSSKTREFRQGLVSTDGRTWRINGRSKDLGSAIYKDKNERLREVLSQWEDAGLRFRLTGTAYLIDQHNELHVRSILSGLVIAIGVIAILILAFTRNLRLMLISLVPNLLPLLLVAALMAILEVELNLSTSIIFSVAFGIAVDDSIHFLSSYVLARRHGVTNLYALKRAMLLTGKSIVLTSVVLFAGFAIFLQSGFSASYHIGFFVCTTLILALLADLILLPALLYRRE